MSNQVGRIDMHHHVVPPRYVDDTPLPITIPDTATQLQWMDGFGIQAAVTSLTPRVFLQHPGKEREIARACNEFQASLIQGHPARFGSFAVLPLPDVDGALAEIAYALDELHLDGVGFFSNQGNVYLGDPRLDPVFEELDRRKAIAFVHPAHCSAPPELNLKAPGATIEYVIDTTRAIVNLLFNGTLKHYPNVRMIFSHGGGTAPFLTHRIINSARGWNPPVPDALQTLQSLYYDTASAAAPYALRSLCSLVDVSHILWGTDLPFVYGERQQQEIDEWEEYDDLDAAAKRAIERDNALRLFPRLGGSA
jgi:predicted TIM-barrel fold metal-dependent hydrolase